MIAGMIATSRKVRALLEQVHPIAVDATVLEVGSGAHGLVFYFGGRGVGVDPLAVSYASLFPMWQREVPTVAGLGEQLPFGDRTFDVVLCDNVVDHAESPAQIVAELIRVLAPGGLLYFTVNIHHPIYAIASRFHDAWTWLGFKYEIRPFADHTVHLTLRRARALFANLPLRIANEAAGFPDAKSVVQRLQLPGMVQKFEAMFFKNASYQVIGVREPE
ncbi:MAG: hypothetical protein QOD75_254 [Blastocatellia bacterium]|nr:hypothetical protein [Blastocatellia bacterium]